MTIHSTKEIDEITRAEHYRPAISIIMPIETKIELKKELLYCLNIAANKVEKELSANYSDELCKMVMGKLRKLIEGLEYNPLKKSIALFVSPVFEKVVYLDITVKQKIIIDESFEIRDLVYSNTQLQKYILLVLNGQESYLYLGDTNQYLEIIPNSSQSVYSYLNELPERVANFADITERKEIVMDKYLHHIDDALVEVLKHYPLHLFVIGTEKMIGHFKNITKNSNAIIQLIEGNYKEATLPELKKILQPFIKAWKKGMQEKLQQQLKKAIDKNVLTTGILQVWKEAKNKNGKLLIVETNYMCPAEFSDNNDTIYAIEAPYNKFSYIKDAVDDTIEMVLINGGIVAFADEESLKDYQHIALIKYY